MSTQALCGRTPRPWHQCIHIGQGLAQEGFILLHQFSGQNNRLLIYVSVVRFHHEARSCEGQIHDQRIPQVYITPQYWSILKVIYLVLSFSWLGCRPVTAEIRGFESPQHRKRGVRLVVRTTLNKLTCFQTNENVQQLNRLILSIPSRKRGFDSFTPLK